MLSAKPWKADAIIRLVLSVIVCVFAGSLLLSVQHYASAGGKVSPRLFFPLAAVALSCLAATLVLISKPWPPEAFGRRLVALLVCAYGGLFLGAWVQQFSGVGAAETSIWRMIVATLSFQGAGLDPDRPLPARAADQLGGGLRILEPPAPGGAGGVARRA